MKLIITAALALGLAGCAPLRIREVKVPVPVSCLDHAPELADVPLSTVSLAQAEALNQSQDWAALADQVAASLRILVADRARLKAATDGCSQVGVQASIAAPAPK